MNLNLPLTLPIFQPEIMGALAQFLFVAILILLILMVLTHNVDASMLRWYNLQNTALALLPTVLVLARRLPLQSLGLGQTYTEAALLSGGILLFQRVAISRMISLITDLHPVTEIKILQKLGIIRILNLDKMQTVWANFRDENAAPQRAIDIAVMSFLLLAAFFVATRIDLSFSEFDILNLGTSLTLLLGGLYIVLKVSDMLSQIYGFLEMISGVYTSAIYFFTRSTATDTEFIYVTFALVIATLLTVAILFFVIPPLHEDSRSLRVDAQKTLNDRLPDAR